MFNIEDQLYKLPKARLGKTADLKIKWRLYRWQKQNQPAVWVFYQPRWVYALASLLLAAIAVPAYAYWSPAVNASHFLYPVKSAIEQVELGLAFTPLAKYETLEKITGKRLAELKKLSVKPSQENEQAIIQSVEAAITNNEAAEAELVKVDQGKDLPIAEAMARNFQAKHKKQLAQSAGNLGVAADETILDNVSLALDKFSSQPIDSRDAVDLSRPASTTRQSGFIINENKKATSTAETPITEKISKQNNGWKKIEAARKQLAVTETDVKLLPNSLPKEKYQAEDVKILLEKLNDKIKKAQEAINSGDFDKSNNLLKSTQAVTKNAKYFVRKNKNKKGEYNETATTTLEKDGNTATSTVSAEVEDIATTSRINNFNFNKINWRKRDDGQSHKNKNDE